MRRAVAAILIAAWGVSSAFAQNPTKEEHLTITTYYPSPYGVYEKLQSNYFAVGDTNHNAGLDSGDLPPNSGSLAVENDAIIGRDANIGNDGNIGRDANIGHDAGIGNDATINRNAKVGGTLEVQDRMAVNAGISSQYRLNVGGTIYASGGGDLAEYFSVTGNVEPGDVVIVNPSVANMLIKTEVPYDVRIAGVIAENPGFLIGAKKSEQDKPLVLIGQINCKVTSDGGPISPGDFLTTSAKPGYAMKFTLLDCEKARDIQELKSMVKENDRRKLAIVGKALEGLEKGEGKIKVLVVR